LGHRHKVRLCGGPCARRRGCQENGAGRLRKAQRGLNPRYARLLEKFGEATGVLLVLNTSFNLKDEPMVATPDNALGAFAKGGRNLLVLESMVVGK